MRQDRTKIAADDYTNPMYLAYYGLKEAPFSITPDPRFVFLSDRHRDGLAHLLYGIGQGGSSGFVQLTGEVGTGKTTLSRLVLESLPDQVRVALILNPRLSPVELVEAICEDLHLDVSHARRSLKELVDALNRYLLQAFSEGLRVVVIIDEAQNLSNDALEQVRLLTNLETPTQKLLQIVLLGQPELRVVLAQPELRQLAQRITARYHLTPLNAVETEAYVRHRIAVGGGARNPFSRLGLRALYRHSHGVPRLINIIADRALMAGFAHEQESIGERLVNRAAKETLPGTPRNFLRRQWRWLAGGATLLFALGIGLIAREQLHSAPIVTPPPAAAAISEPVNDDAERLNAFSRALKQTPDADINAWMQLLSRWQITSAEIASVKEATRCPTTIAPGIDCLHGHGTLEQLARFDRPLLLLLENDGAHATALLSGTSKQRVRLDFAGSHFDLDKQTLAQFWPGEFIAIWRLPSNVPLALKKGDTGPGIAWVKDQLSRLDGGKQADIGPAYFDAALEERIRKLQQAYSISADGIIGPETLLALSALDETGPHLVRNVD
ncbi:AAA family ATPase [Pseudolysobacter antarcticus]|uniref:AAA family ATPase n=2 Tax=Pseudolysobacter antarcticus TaxID=2511995 RepID=A0A411HNZ8_9GAMM|nr:AAA family ATPase [Pseudolysobacter antarcticus]